MLVIYKNSTHVTTLALDTHESWILGTICTCILGSQVTALAPATSGSWTPATCGSWILGTIGTWILGSQVTTLAPATHGSWILCTCSYFEVQLDTCGHWNVGGWGPPESCGHVRPGMLATDVLGSYISKCLDSALAYTWTLDKDWS
jgi:hypothetical protein